MTPQPKPRAMSLKKVAFIYFYDGHYPKKHRSTARKVWSYLFRVHIDPLKRNLGWAENLLRKILEQSPEGEFAEAIREYASKKEV